MDEIVNREKTQFRADRCPAESYEDIIARDVVPAPDFYKEGPTPDIGTEPVKAARYFDPEFFQKECDYVFNRVWQWACREEDIPEVGDHMVFDLAGYSWIIVRSAPDEIKALANACLHRGRQLVEADGTRMSFRCPYHGLEWHCDGSLKHNPFDWDMPQWEECDTNLPEAKVALWGGFVFINMDHYAPPLEDVLAPIPEHFERYDLAGKYKAVHVIKKIRANWKATSEAFMESHHVVGTHPQALAQTGDINSQYDNWTDYVGRQFTAYGVQSPNVEGTLTQQQIFDGAIVTTPTAARDPDTTVPEGMSARAFVAERTRAAMNEEFGHDYSKAGDAEMIDALLYNVFPNMAFWAGTAQNIVYRFRPNGLDPESSLMDIVALRPFPKDGPRPDPVPILHLDFDEPLTGATEIGEGLALVFDQDVENLPWVQKGLRALRGGNVSFTSYMEKRLRRHHQMLDTYIDDGENG